MTMRILLCFSIFLFSLPSLFAQDKRIALVIGNSIYEHGGSLKNPVNDANLMATTLEELGFDVIKRTDATKQEMESAIVDFWRVLANYDVNLFYYAGHGVQVDGVNYLLPTDAELEDEFSLTMEAINVAKVVSQFERYPNNVNIVLLDACRDNPFRSWMRSGTGGFVAMTAPSGTIIAFATSPGATASDGTGEYGLYTEHLTHQMHVEQRIEDVFIHTRNRVREVSNGRQNPQEWSQLRGSFYFKTPTPVNQAIIPGEIRDSAAKSSSPSSSLNTYEKLKYKEFGLIRGMYLNEKRLNKREVQIHLRQTESPSYSMYNNYFTQEIWGFLASGFGITVASVALTIDVIADPPIAATITVGTIGVGISITGIALLIKSTQSFNKFIHLYNPDPYRKFAISPTQDGIGLVYRF